MPGIRVNGIYSDNVLLAPKGQEDDDVILEVSPSLTASSRSPRAQYDLFYELRNVWRVAENETALARHALNANGRFALAGDRLWVDLTGYMGSFNASAEGPIASDPGASFVNVAKVRRFSVSPWFRDRLGDSATYLLRYYAAHTAGDINYAVAKLDQRASASVEGLARESSPWTWQAHADFQRRDFDGGLSGDRAQSGVRLYYRVNQELRVFGALDHERIEGVRNRDGDGSGYGPGGGFDWSPNTRTSVGASVSRRYYGTVSSARAAYRSARSTWGLRYSRSILTGSDASLLLIDPQALTSGEPGAFNPVLEGLVLNRLVPPVNPLLTPGLVTDVAFLDRRLVLFYGLHGARNSLIVELFAADSESTSEFSPTGVVSGIVGSSPAGGVFVGKFRDRGVSATHQFRIDPRSSLNLTVNYRANASSTADFDTRMTTLQIAHILRVTRDTLTSLGVRHSRQTASGTATSYTENAVFGGIEMRFR